MKPKVCATNGSMVGWLDVHLRKSTVTNGFLCDKAEASNKGSNGEKK